MHIILGATGHIGSALAQLLLERGEPVTVILHTPDKADEWQRRGAQTAVADVYDTAALRAVFRQGQRLFLLNPPAAPATDTAAEERRSVAAILGALDGSGLHKVVAESTYSAQPGDLGVLYEMEQALAAQPIPVSIIRAAYYMSNWDMALASAQKEGKAPSLYPADFKLPMVAPTDVAQVAAQLLTEPIEQTGLHNVEGPEAYSAWGEVWSRPGLSRHDRSLITLALLIALNREEEFKMHVRAAFNNGVTKDELKELILHTSLYCGLPAANAAYHAAEAVLATLEP